MKFPVDAHLPRRLARLLISKGYNALHTLDLPDGNFTTDQAINELSIREERIVITKDSDFVNSFLIRKTPFKLLLVSTGNIKNTDLENLFQANIDRIVSLFEKSTFVEMNRDSIIIHN